MGMFFERFKLLSIPTFVRKCPIFLLTVDQRPRTDRRTYIGSKFDNDQQYICFIGFLRLPFGYKVDGIMQIGLGHLKYKTRDK